MRTIKFRGKRVDTGEWTYGYLFKIWEQTYILWGTTNGVPNMIEVIPETVVQYTGHQDKNGKEIYEGDLMDSNDSGHLIIQGMVDYRNGRYVLGQTEGREDDLCDVVKVGYTVIGNIHDNPELLK